MPPFLLPIYEAAGTAYGIPWQILAAINEVETDYGTNLDTSSAGAIGWMQFLPSTWLRYGVDASASGCRDPYNAADAIFAAARYLAAAGAAHDLPGAIYAYNHSWGYVRSVLLRAQLLSGEPVALIQSIGELAEGDLPDPARLPRVLLDEGLDIGTDRDRRDRRRDGCHRRGSGARDVGAATVSRAVTADCRSTPLAMRRSWQPGRHGRRDRPQPPPPPLLRAGAQRLRRPDSPTATSARGAVVPGAQAAPKPSSSLPAASRPGPRPGSAGQRRDPEQAGGRSMFRTTSGPGSVHARLEPRRRQPQPQSTLIGTPVFTPLALLNRSGTGGAATTHHQAPRRPSIMAYFTGAFGIPANRLELVPLRVGSHVFAGTILGRLSPIGRPHLLFSLQPAASGRRVDARPFLDSWTQLDTLELHRQGLSLPYYGPETHATHRRHARS